jgi:hypothetical protein
LRVPIPYVVAELSFGQAARSDARICKTIRVNEQYRLSLNFEVFNIGNSWSLTSMTTQAYIESKGVLTLTPTAYCFGTSDAMNPDCTQARRMQGALASYSDQRQGLCSGAARVLSWLR